MSKLKDGRDEKILDPDLIIIDSHHHFFIRPNVHYMFDEYLEDVYAGHKILASVYVETQFMSRPDAPELFRPLGEIEFANGMGAMAASGFFGPSRVAAAIVGYADLRFGDQVGELLDRAMVLAPERFRGIRQMAMAHPDPAVLGSLVNKPPSDLLQQTGFRKGLQQLAKRGLSFDAVVLHHQLPELAALVAQHPDLIFVLNHMGLATAMNMAPQGRAEVFKTWREGLRELARAPNVVCKVGGLGTLYWGFGFDTSPTPTGYLELAEAWHPYVEAAIEAFGPERCMMESDYPPDGRSCGFVPLWNALKHITRDYTADEKAAMFHGTAARVYGITLPGV